jgi:hypothetical protein
MTAITIKSFNDMTREERLDYVEELYLHRLVMTQKEQEFFEEYFDIVEGD